MNRPKRQSSILFGVLGLLLIVTLGSTALGQHIRGALEGTINDPNGAVVEGAAVTLKNVGTGISSTATTDDRGRFNFQNLEPGNYSVTVEKTGFRKYVATDVIVKVGSVTPLTANLEVGSAT